LVLHLYRVFAIEEELSLLKGSAAGLRQADTVQGPEAELPSPPVAHVAEGPKLFARARDDEI
jgi:hypothetical protein